MNILEVEKINPCVWMAAELNELSVLREALRGGLWCSRSRSMPSSAYHLPYQPFGHPEKMPKHSEYIFLHLKSHIQYLLIVFLFFSY